MSEIEYYSKRMGINKNQTKLDLSKLLQMFSTIFNKFDRDGYFQESFGYDCTDDGFVPGKVKHKAEDYLQLKLSKTNLIPVKLYIDEYMEEDLFDIIEFYHEHCSKPIEGSGHYHSWNNCGWHYGKFEKKIGQEEFRSEINQILSKYNDGYELSDKGYICNLPENGLEHLFKAELPEEDSENISDRIEAACIIFRRYKSSLEERRNAVNSLAKILEYLKPQINEVISSQDEKDLFHLANKFNVRHHNRLQKNDFDPIWYSWMFYHYLATIHAVIRLAKCKKNSNSE